MRKPVARVFAILIGAVLAGCAAHPASAAPVAVAPAPPSRWTAGFLGGWTGVLEYRDFQSDAQVLLPTWLTISEAADRASLQLSYVYDDGPGKTVREVMTIALDPATATMSFGSDRDHTHERYQVAGLDDFTRLGRGTLVLTGAGTENEHPVDVRITLTLRRNLYTLRKETHPPGEPFRFRDAYTFTRAAPPEPARSAQGRPTDS